jgi:hypothetical protein
LKELGGQHPSGKYQKQKIAFHHGAEEEEHTEG